MICAEEDPTYEVDVNIEKILSSLGFAPEIHDNLVSSLKGGDRFGDSLSPSAISKARCAFFRRAYK